MINEKTYQTSRVEQPVFVGHGQLRVNNPMEWYTWPPGNVLPRTMKHSEGTMKHVSLELHATIYAESLGIGSLSGCKSILSSSAQTIKWVGLASDSFEPKAYCKFSNEAPDAANCGIPRLDGTVSCHERRKCCVVVSEMNPEMSMFHGLIQQHY